MSSHREAPEISKDPSADNTDVYAWISPEKPSMVNIIANFNPFELPYGGPNFSEFDDDVTYDINISNSMTAQADITYRFTFKTTIRNPNTFLYNTGQITDIDSPNWNRPQTYTVTRMRNGRPEMVIGEGLKCPPVNVGARSTPNYAALAQQAVTTIGSQTFFAGQRSDAFFVDLGSIFDLGGLRPLNAAHLLPLQNMPGVNGLQGLNVHTIAIQVPRQALARDGYLGGNVDDKRAVIGVWAAASRSQNRNFDASTGAYENFGGLVQVSRLGNPLFNEVLTPMAKKTYWNSQPPRLDSQFAQYVTQPELQGLLPVLYPGAFPNLAAYTKPRADLAAILLTGIPKGVVPGLNTYTGPTQADMLRLNMAIPPNRRPNPMGVLGGDLAGFPNGRRPIDNVTKIELQAIAGATIPLVDPSYTPDAVVGSVTDGTTNTNPPLLPAFPYLGTPGGGYQSMPGTSSTATPPAA